MAGGCGQVAPMIDSGDWQTLVPAELLVAHMEHS